jgi:hypothetical protein
MFRLLLAVIFLFSYIIFPLRYVISTIWARIIESDKPVFTLIFGGAAAFANGISELVKHLYRRPGESDFTTNPRKYCCAAQTRKSGDRYNI